MSNPVVSNVLKGEFQSYEEEHKKTRYKLFAGINGNFATVEEFNNQDEADKAAYNLAWEEYEGYGGYHGLLDEDAIREEMIDEYCEGSDDVDLDSIELNEDEVQERYKEQVESWIEWRAEECDGDCLNCDEAEECEQKDEITP